MISVNKFLVGLGFASLVAGCSSQTSEIDGEEVLIDSISVYRFKSDKSLVTGKVVFHEVDSQTNKKFIKSTRKTKNGKRIERGYDYFPSGVIGAEYQYDSNGLISGTAKYYFETGELFATVEFKNNKQDGIAKEFNDNGEQVKEIIFQQGQKINEYEFDQAGNKIIPVTEQMELAAIKTGFLEYVNYNSDQILYQPIVIMKWRNKTNQPITENIRIEGVFIDNKKQEEMATDIEFFQGRSAPPLQPNLSRQCALKSTVGYTTINGTYDANISCQILINKQIFQTVRIANNFLKTNRIQ